MGMSFPVEDAEDASTEQVFQPVFKRSFFPPASGNGARAGPPSLRVNVSPAQRPVGAAPGPVSGGGGGGGRRSFGDIRRIFYRLFPHMTNSADRESHAVIDSIVGLVMNTESGRNQVRRCR